MNQNLVEVILRLRDEASGALRQVARAAEEARARIGSLSDNLGQVARGLQGLGSSLGAILGSAGLTYALKNAADTAFQAKASMQSLAVAAAQAGTSLDEVLGTLEPLLDRLGVLPEQASGAVAMLLRAGLSVQQIAQAFEAGAASALAAGETAARGIENVAMALATGQSIYLNYIGVAENIGPVMQKVASSMQGASEEAIKQAQAQAALNVILRATAGEVAAMPAFLQGYAAAQNRLNQSLYEFRTAIGNAVIPYLTALYDLIGEGVSWINSLDESTKRAIGTGAVAAGGLLGLGTALGLLLPVVQNAVVVVKGLAGALLALAANPVTLVVAGAAYLAVAWAKSAETLEESRKRFALLGQTLMGLYDLIKGVFQSIVGLLSSVGQIFATIARAFVRVVQGDFRGAWEEVQRGLNLEVFAAKFEAANQSLVRGWNLLGQTLRGEVSESAAQVVQRVEALVGRINASLEAARKANEVQLNLAQATKSTATAYSEAGSAAQSASEKTTRLTDAVDALRKRYELGDFTLGQYLQSLQGLLAKWEPHLQALQAGTEEWHRYAEAVLAARKAIEDAMRSYSQMTRYEQERRGLRDFSIVMTGPEVRGVEGWRDAILDTMRLGSGAFGRLMDQIAALEARLARGGLSAQAEAELRAVLEAAQRTAKEWEREILAALEAEGQEKLDAARALGQNLGEQVAQGFDKGFARALDVLLTSGDTGYADYAAKALGGMGDSVARFRRWREELRSMEPLTTPEWQTSASGLLTFLQSIPNQAEGALRVVRELAREMGPGELQEVIAANIQYLQSLQAQVPPTTEQHRVLEQAIGELRVMYLELAPAVQTASAAVVQAIPDYVDVAGAAQMWTERLEELRARLRDGSISTEEFARQAGEIRGIIQAVLPQWQSYLKRLEEQGVATDEAREALARLNEILAQTPGYLQAVQRERLDAWARDLAGAIQTATSAIGSLFDAFSAQTIGGGISQFSRGVSGILSFIPGIGQGVASLVGAIGDALGRVIDGILSAFDSGWGRVQTRVQEAARGLLLVDPAIFQRAVEQYTESYLLGLVNVTKYRVNEEVLRSLQEAAKAAEGAVRSGLRSALTAEDPVAAFRESVYSATLDAVVSALMESEAVRAALSPYTTALAEAIAQGSAEGVLRAAQGLAEAFANLEELLAPIREAFAQMRREMEASRMWEDAQRGAATAVESAIRAGARAALEGRDIAEAWRQALYQSTLDALVQAFLNQGWMRALQPLLDQLASAILASDEAAIPAIMAQIAAVIEAISRHMDDLGPIAEELRKLFGIVEEAGPVADEAARRLEEAARGVGGAVRGALQAALTAEDPAQAWREAVYRSTLDALVGALLESEAIRAALQPLQDALAQAIAQGNVEGILQATEALAGAMDSIAPALEQIREVLRSVFGGQEGVAGGGSSFLARSIADVVREGLRSALTGEDWQNELAERIGSAIMDAVVQAAVSEALIEGILGPIVDALQEAIAAGNWQAVSTLATMLGQGAQSLVSTLAESLSPLADQFGALHRTATSAAQGLERVAGATTNLPSWYKVDLARYQAAAPVQVHIYGNIYGVDDLVGAIEEARRRRGYAVTGGWA